MHLFLSSFQKYITPSDTIILAVSGGVDSMVLFDIVLGLHPKQNIVVAHFDHGLRGEESDGDGVFVREKCQENTLVCEYKKENIRTLAQQQKQSIESSARFHRYQFLSQVAKKYNAKYILTAHHLDDRIETAMLNLIRGSKLSGITALSEISGRGEYILLRPLLHLPKSQLLAYAHEHHIQYREDSSNTDRDYLRNKLRHDVLPEFSALNPEYRKSLENFIEYARELQLWIDREIHEWLSGESEDEANFSVKNFSLTSPFFQKEVIRYLYTRANSGTIGLSEGNIDEILRFILSATGGTQKELQNLRLIKKKNHISVV